MKYTRDNPPVQCFMRQSKWYRGTGTVPVRGVLIHSTGANNPYIKRYVQPDDTAPDREELLSLLGTNKNGNDWNHSDREAGVHAFVGKLASGRVASVQTGPWDKKAWGCGSGKKGSCNNGWIQFEICEDGLTDPVYFAQVYREAVELTAYLCALYGLDPLGTVQYSGVTVPVILCHQDSYRLGLGGNHADVYPWFGKHNKTMDDFRADVSRTMKGETEMTDEQVKQLTDCAGTGDTPSEWAKEATDFCKRAGIFNGDGEGNYGWQQPITREAVAQILYNTLEKAGLTGKLG